MMPTQERPDIRTRFKKGQSGNPSGRPKGGKNKALQIEELLFKKVRVSDGEGVRSVPKIAAALEVCMNSALKGDMRALDRILKIAERLESIQWTPPIPEITSITRTIVYPKNSPLVSSPFREVTI